MNRELATISKKASNHKSFIAVNLLVIILGVAGVYVYDGQIDKDILETVITFCGVITGFVITSMLFSGRSPYADSLSIDQAARYAIKMKYMLMSQANTLFAFLFCLGFSVAAVLAMKANAVESTKALCAVASGYFFLGSFRTLLLPYQIYDVHAFALDHLIEAKRQDSENKAKSAHEKRRAALQDRNNRGS